MNLLHSHRSLYLIIHYHPSSCFPIPIHHHQVAEKLKETRKYFALFNTLNDRRTFLNKEVEILEFLIANVNSCFVSTQSKEAFLNSFRATLEGVARSTKQVNDRLTQDQAALEVVEAKYNSCVDEQRNYFKAVKVGAMKGTTEGVGDVIVVSLSFLVSLSCFRPHVVLRSTFFFSRELSFFLISILSYVHLLFSCFLACCCCFLHLHPPLLLDVALFQEFQEECYQNERLSAALGERSVSTF